MRVREATQLAQGHTPNKKQCYRLQSLKSLRWAEMLSFQRELPSQAGEQAGEVWRRIREEMEGNKGRRSREREKRAAMPTGPLQAAWWPPALSGPTALGWCVLVAVESIRLFQRVMRAQLFHNSMSFASFTRFGGIFQRLRDVYYHNRLEAEAGRRTQLPSVTPGIKGSCNM